MPLIRVKTIWTPLALLGIKLLKDDEGRYYIRVFGGEMKKITS
ncbi:hypothetical protein N0O92_08920 [Alkalihalobacillus sp. MEB130]|nr:hypothetical protein [Alkalihalobacillus sp. MEB130]MDT8860354.1 hypothetical protein [Alkalihalobacillus sp. MEB130]